MVRTALDLGVVTATAIEVVDTGGYDALSLSAVASALGVGPSALYSHVDGLAGLQQVTALESTRRLTTEIRNAAIGQAGDDAIRAVGNAYRAHVAAFPGRFTATLRAPDDHDSMAGAHRDLDEVFVLVCRAHGLDAASTESLARNIRRAIHGFVVLEHTTGGADRRADADYAALLDGLCLMLAGG